MARVTVIGAGPGGLAVALGLVATGHEVHVLERAGEPRPEGAAVTLWPNGTAVLAALGVPLEGLGARIDTLETRTDRGQAGPRMPTARLSARFATPTVSAPRRALVERLLAALPAGTVRYGVTCLGVNPATGRVTHAHATGMKADINADVVVGADGRSSVVRSAVRPGAISRPTGWVTWQGLSRVPIEVTGSTRILTMTGRAGFLGLQPAGDGLLQWYFSVPPGRPLIGPDPVAALRERFGSWADPVPAVLAAISGAGTAPWPHHSLRVPRVWGAGRVTLVGDAAHAMPPSLAQGVNQTLEDAHALTRALAGAGSDDVPTPALRCYEARRAQQLRRIVARTRSEASTSHRGSLAMRAMPDRLATAIYAHLLEASSSVLATPPLRQSRGPAAP